MSRRKVEFDIEKAIKLFKDGKSVIEIAKEINVKPTLVRVKLKNKLGDEYLSIGQEKEKQRCLVIIRSMLANYENVADIMRATGRSRLITLEYISEIESETVVKPKVILKEKEYTKRKIDYSGWRYRMCRTWGFNMAQ